jgi:hypothetical protein
MSQELHDQLVNQQLSPDEQNRIFQAIHDRILDDSAWITDANFDVFHPRDLEHMFDLYDQILLNGACRAALQGRPLTFHLSKRMTRAGGQTAWKTITDRRRGIVREEFAISVSVPLLFQTFRNEERTIKVTGLECHNRLQAMQRIMEHEIIHLAERLVWKQSSCRARRFQSIATRLFGHQAHTHDLVTTAEIARQEKGIQRGSRVVFLHEGHRRIGIVNRLTRRATVLVPDTSGRLYSDGCRYSKFYVPLNMLQNAEASE